MIELGWDERVDGSKKEYTFPPLFGEAGKKSLYLVNFTHAYQVGYRERYVF